MSLAVKVAGGALFATGVLGIGFGEHNMSEEGKFKDANICYDRRFSQANPDECSTSEGRIRAIDIEGQRAQDAIKISTHATYAGLCLTGAGLVICVVEATQQEV